MARKVTADNFADAIAGILEEYEANAEKTTAEVVKEITKTGVKAVKDASKTFRGTGKYAKGWTSKFETGRLSSQGTIYNKDVPGLPHLLEHGHAKRGGGRVPGTVHIKPVEDEISKAFEKELELRL